MSKLYGPRDASGMLALIIRRVEDWHNYWQHLFQLAPVIMRVISLDVAIVQFYTCAHEQRFSAMKINKAYHQAQLTDLQLGCVLRPFS